MAPANNEANNENKKRINRLKSTYMHLEDRSDEIRLHPHKDLPQMDKRFLNFHPIVGTKRMRAFWQGVLVVMFCAVLFQSVYLTLLDTEDGKAGACLFQSMKLGTRAFKVVAWFPSAYLFLVMVQFNVLKRAVGDGRLWKKADDHENTWMVATTWYKMWIYTTFGLGTAVYLVLYLTHNKNVDPNEAIVLFARLIFPATIWTFVGPASCDNMVIFAVDLARKLAEALNAHLDCKDRERLAEASPTAMAHDVSGRHHATRCTLFAPTDNDLRVPFVDDQTANEEIAAAIEHPDKAERDFWREMTSKHIELTICFDEIFAAVTGSLILALADKALLVAVLFSLGVNAHGVGWLAIIAPMAVAQVAQGCKLLASLAGITAMLQGKSFAHKSTKTLAAGWADFKMKPDGLAEYMNFKLHLLSVQTGAEFPFVGVIDYQLVGKIASLAAAALPTCLKLGRTYAAMNNGDKLFNCTEHNIPVFSFSNFPNFTNPF